MRQANIVRVEISKREECDDALRHAMNVHRIGAIMKVSGSTVLAEEVVPIELEATADGRFELRRLQVAGDAFQRAEVVSGVEVVDPLLRRGLPVVPRAVVVLLSNRVAGDPESGTKEFPLAGMPVHPAEESRSKEVGVVNLSPQ